MLDHQIDINCGADDQFGHVGLEDMLRREHEFIEWRKAKRTVALLLSRVSFDPEP